MIERRTSNRRRCLLGARVVFNSRNSTMSCTIRNYAEDGALLLFGEQPYIPDMLELVLDNHKTLTPAQVVWRSGTKIGIIFPRGRFMAELREVASTNRVMLVNRREGEPLH
jgi:hypothetical protein